jgi:hypothetical protein
MAFVETLPPKKTGTKAQSKKTGAKTTGKKAGAKRATGKRT